MLVQHSVLYFLGRIIPAAVGVLALALYTRLLTPDQYGIYALVIAAMSIINAVFFHWLSLSLGRFLPVRDSDPEALFATALLALTILILCTGAAGATAAWLWPEPRLRGFVLLAVILAWGQAWFDLNLSIANARLAPVRYGLLSSVKALVALGAGLLLLHLGLGVAGVLAGLLTGLLGASLLGWRCWRGCSLLGGSVEVMKSFIAYGGPLTITFLLVLVVDVSDRFFLAWLLDAEAVGGYAAAYDLTQQSLGLLAGVIHLAAFPLAVRALEERGADAARKQLSQNGYLLLAVVVPATLGIVMLANSISSLVLGEEFREAGAAIMGWIAIAVLVGSCKSFYLDYSFQLGRKMRLQVWTVVVAAAVNVFLNLLWIPVYGIEGAAFATIAALVAGFVSSAYLGRRVSHCLFLKGSEKYWSHRVRWGSCCGQRLHGRAP